MFLEEIIKRRGLLPGENPKLCHSIPFFNVPPYWSCTPCGSFVSLRSQNSSQDLANASRSHPVKILISGPEGLRSPCLMHAMHALYQLSYGPRVRKQEECLQSFLFSERGVSIGANNRYMAHVFYSTSLPPIAQVMHHHAVGRRR